MHNKKTFDSLQKAAQKAVASQQLFVLPFVKG